MARAVQFIYKGAATISRLAPRGMITIRGDLASSSIHAVVKMATGFTCPGPRAAEVNGEYGVAWMSPDELLLMLPASDLRSILSRLEDAVAGDHALIADVTGARAIFQIAGPHARDVLAKLVPVDLSPAVFGPGMARRTRMAQAAAAFWMNGEAIELVCFSSVADYAFELLSNAARPGSEVDFL